jgi:salicylate 5-hydroxylase large subunit
MHECPVTVFPQQIRWETEGTSRIPFQAYTDERSAPQGARALLLPRPLVLRRPRGRDPEPGDFKRTVVGERSVMMVRDKDGSIHVVENVCAHRGMAFCRERHGNRKDLHLPVPPVELHAGKGDLQGVPFRRGVKQDGKVNGGMPADFKPAEHGLTN